jgi:mono-ADP-ribosyltransferase sirtuin 6
MSATPPINMSLLRVPVRVRNERDPVGDSEQIIMQKITYLQDWLKTSKYTVVLTGDDINSVYVRAIFHSLQYRNNMPTYKPRKKTHTFRFPGFCHLALAKLFKQELIHHVVTQGVNGMHIASGIPQENVTELFGNVNIQGEIGYHIYLC